MIIRRACEGESIYDIAAEYAISAGYLCEVAGVGRRTLPKGREVAIHLPSRTTTAKSGDSVESIARRFGVGVAEILALNPEIAVSGRVYPSQYVVLRLADAKVGVAVINGEIFHGITADRVRRALPYLDTLTVGAARACGRQIKCDRHLIKYSEMAVARGIDTVLRIYVDGMPSSERAEFCVGAVMLAAAKGFNGIRLGGLNKLGDEATELVVELKKRTIEAGLTLSVEADGTGKSEYAEYADCAVMTVDKIHNENIPSFAECEGRIITADDEGCEPSGRLIELPSFAYSEGGYIARDEAMSLCDSKDAVIEHNDETMCMTVSSRRRWVRMENLANVCERIRLAAECGYLGVSVDIGRVPFSELYSVYAMTMRPVHIGKVESRLNCLGERLNG